MAAQQQQQHFFIKTDSDGSFQKIVTWIFQQGVQITGSCEASLPYISGNNQIDELRWRCEYDFCRTAAVTLRLMMLKGTGLQEYHNPNSRSPARERNESRIGLTTYQSINNQCDLAGSKVEAQWISGYFDKLFPYWLLKCQLSSMQPGEIRSLTNELIVVDTYHHIFWQMIVSLQVERLLPDFLRFEAKPTFTVNRFELKQQPIRAPNYPWLNSAPEPRLDQLVAMTASLKI